MKAERKNNNELLLALLRMLLDGIDGFESEHGTLRYWNEEAVEEARDLIRTSTAA